MKNFKIEKEYSFILSRFVYRVYQRVWWFPLLWEFMGSEDSMSKATNFVEELKSTEIKYL